jgi:phosphomevalonate kinase
LIARAPGKVVLSGAYAVLHGAPALVAAVDRYVLADTARPAEFVTPEVRAALGEIPAPWFDASALRESGRKLGLGSSAAIVVASLAAVLAEREGVTDELTLRDAVFDRALVAHRSAQGGGSGVDVAASAWGGFIAARRHSSALDVRPIHLPPSFVQVWTCAAPASTSDFLRKVEALERDDPAKHTSLMAHLTEASVGAESAVDLGDAEALLLALAAQRDGLYELGRAAGIPIVTDEVRQLSKLAAADGAVFMPAGAGGGDIATYFGHAPPSPRFLARAPALGLAPLECALGASGVHLDSKNS